MLTFARHDLWRVQILEKVSDTRAVGGVPYFELHNAAMPDKVIALSGAQGPDVFLRAFSKL